MNPIKVDNLFSQSEIDKFHSMTDSIRIPLNEDGSWVYEENTGFSISKELGRIQLTITELDSEFVIKLTNIVNSTLGTNYSMSGATYVEYSSEYGTPDLPPHFDGDSTDLMVNYQFVSNTSWAIGLDNDTYELQDNSALLFNPNKSIHWRTKKVFRDKEFVKMIFFRFLDLNNIKDNSHLRYSLDNDILKEANKVRNSA